jgi:phosphate transport system substrate-binding protein
VDEEAVPPVALEIDDTVYEYGKNLGAEEYPLNRDLHCYTWEGTSPKEAAFLMLLVSDLGQERYVAGNNYVTLPTSRQEEEVGKLPAPEQGSPQDFIGGSSSETTSGGSGNETASGTQTTTSQ